MGAAFVSMPAMKELCSWSMATPGLYLTLTVTAWEPASPNVLQMLSVLSKEKQQPLMRKP